MERKHCLMARMILSGDMDMVDFTQIPQFANLLKRNIWQNPELGEHRYLGYVALYSTEASKVKKKLRGQFNMIAMLRDGMGSLAMEYIELGQNWLQWSQN